MSVNSRRVRAIVRKELRDFRRNRSLTVGMAVIPVMFCVQPLVAVFTLDPAASTTLRHAACSAVHARHPGPRAVLRRRVLGGR